MCVYRLLAAISNHGLTKAYPRIRGHVLMFRAALSFPITVLHELFNTFIVEIYRWSLTSGIRGLYR